MRMSHALWGATILGVVLADPVGAATVRVPLDQPTILAGLDSASPGDTVLVAPGTYSATDLRIVDIGGAFDPYVSCGFLVDGVVLRSEGGSAVTTIASPGGTAVLVGSNLLSSATAVVGFTIQAPSGSGIDAYSIATQRTGLLRIEDCVFADLVGALPSSAGAVKARLVSLDVRGCSFARCNGVLAAGIFSDGPSLVIDSCTFSDNPTRAVVYDQTDVLGSCVVSNSRFERNVAGGGSSLDFDEVESIHVRDCVFADNVGTGTVRLGSAAPMSPNYAVVERNLFVGNTAASTLGGAPALYWIAHPGDLRDNTFWGNSALVSTGPGCLLLGTAPNTTVRVERNLIGGTAIGVGIADIGSGTVISDCNVFWDNPDGNWLAGFYPAGANEVFADPQLCAPDLGDYTVASSSPCLPANNACGVQIGAFGQGCGPVSVEQKSWGAIKAAYRGGETGN